MNKGIDKIIMSKYISGCRRVNFVNPRDYSKKGVIYRPVHYHMVGDGIRGGGLAALQSIIRCHTQESLVQEDAETKAIRYWQKAVVLEFKTTQKNVQYG